MKRTLGEVARLIGGRILGDESVVLTGVSGIREAQPGHLTFLSNPKYSRYLATTRASAVIVEGGASEAAGGGGCPALLVTENAYAAFARAMEIFVERTGGMAPGVHPAAFVAGSARLGQGVAIGPHAVVLDDAEIGDGAAIHPGAYVGAGAKIGRGSVIGSDGFGFAREGTVQVKVPQLGNVVVEDDVEIGANVCIARATVGTTRVGKGTKIDNLVQIAHNVVIGEGSVVVAQVGISGSTEIGDRVVLGGQAGIAGHIRVGDDAMVGAQAGVTKSVPTGEQVSGYPARRHTAAKRLSACVQSLPDLFRRVRGLEKRLARLEKEDEC